MAKKKRCSAKTTKGKRCRNGAAVDGVCLAHAPRNVKEERGFGGPQGGSGRPRKPRPDDVLRERIEADIDRYLAPIEAALGAGKPVQMWDTAEGKHHIEYVPDPALGLKAIKLAFERAFGKPRQALEVTGEGGGALKSEIDFADDDVREAMHGLVRAVADAREGESGGSGSGG